MQPAEKPAGRKRNSEESSTIKKELRKRKSSSASQQGNKSRSKRAYMQPGEASRESRKASAWWSMLVEEKKRIGLSKKPNVFKNRILQKVLGNPF